MCCPLLFLIIIAAAAYGYVKNKTAVDAAIKEIIAKFKK